MELEGKVFSGMGIAKEYLKMKEYQNRIENTTGFNPFPGTLNLRSNQERVTQTLRKANSRRINSFSKQGEEYSGITVYKASLKSLEAAVLRMDVTDYKDRVIEVASPCKLREKLEVEDGDTLNIKIKNY